MRLIDHPEFTIFESTARQCDHCRALEELQKVSTVFCKSLRRIIGKLKRRCFYDVTE
jgi:hypothetical protein